VALKVRDDSRDDLRPAHRRSLQVTRWIAVAVVAAIAIAVAAAGWAHRSSSSSPSDGPGTVAPDSSIVVTFDDHGLHVAPATAHAGIIQVGFADKRANPTGELLLYYAGKPGPGDDLVAGPGGSPRVVFCANRWYFVAQLNGKVVGQTTFEVTGTASECRSS